MATIKRNYPNNYFVWYNDDLRLAILERVTSSDSSNTHSQPWDTFQSSGDLSGSITLFANWTTTVSGTTAITSSAHGLTDGDRVTITSSPDSYYDGNYAITKIDTDRFYIVKSYSAEDDGTWTSLFVDDGLRITFHSNYEEVDAVTDDLYTSCGLDIGLHHSLICYLKARLYEDMGDLQTSGYFRTMFREMVQKYPSRKSGVRALSVPRL